MAEPTGSLKPGDRVRLTGGYEAAPAWLGGKTEVDGTVSAFVPGQNSEPAAVVRLDRAIHFGEVVGEVAVLELRYLGATWESRGTVHIELCDFQPEPKPWQERRQGKWVESHATYIRE